MAASKDSRAGASARTAAEHEAIRGAMQVLEKALVSPVPGREDRWLRRAGAALAVVVDYLRQHVESPENESGLYPELERALGRPRELTAARRGHEPLLAQAQRLLEALDQEPPAVSCPQVRERALALTAALLAHQAREADLIMMAFQQDIGAGD